VSFFEVGDQVLVFDSREWEKTGDIGDNRQFYKPATIRALYQYDGFELADVQFRHREALSKGHFTNGFKTLD
jgi:hypothetical protein